MDYKEWMHLWHRAGFGPPLTEWQTWEPLSRAQAVDLFIQQSSVWEPLDIAEKPSKPLIPGRNPRQQTRHLRQLQLEELGRMNIQAMNLLAFSPEQLREKMFLFWHGYFACFVPYSWLLQNHINLLRKHALGNVKNLLVAVAKDAAMMEFLNTTQNRKAHPNENFARELMELYTLGRGHYQEKDIQEAAKAFTGWYYDPECQFVLIPQAQDKSPLQFRGRQGNFSGEDIIHQLVEDPQMAIHFCTRLYRFFVNHETPDPNHIAEMAEVLRGAQYEILPVLSHVFTADWFYKPEQIGAQIKSPADLITGLRRQFGIEFKDEQVLLYLQKVLGQVVGHPPNVAGWPGGKQWIDGATLIFRLRLADGLFSNADLPVEVRENAEDIPLGKRMKSFNTQLSWEHLNVYAEGKKGRELTRIIAEKLVVRPGNLADRLPEPAHLLDAIRRVLRSPEYQMC